MKCSCNRCCHENLTNHSLCIAVNVYIAVNSIKPLSVAMEMHDWNPAVLLLSNRIIYTAVNNMNLLRSSCKVLDIVVQF